MDGSPGRHPGARLAMGRRQCAQVPGGRAPGPSRAGFLYIKSGASSSLQQWRSKRRWQRSLPPVAAPLGQRALSFTESPEDFPPGPCEASSSHFCCWRWSSARRPGGQLLQCPQAQVEGLSWPRCTRAAATGLWVSVPRVRSPSSYPQREGTSAGGNLSPQLGILLGSWACLLSFY